MEPQELAWWMEVPLFILLLVVGYHCGVVAPVTLVLCLFLYYFLWAKRHMRSMAGSDTQKARRSLHEELLRITPRAYWATVAVSCGLLILTWILGDN